METIDVEVKQGVLRGRVATSQNGRQYYSFEGIPYARPPVGDLRFKAPQPPVSWEGIHDATKPGNKCVQMNLFTGGKLEGSEDCLYLNVYTPSLPSNSTEKLPIIVYVHGGRLISGFGHYYRPDYFIEQNSIVVTINYRLHILGFLCLNTPDVPGNAGMKDVIQALRWLKENIALFNGNPENVTAVGESAGAGIVTSLVASKMADGLYSKVIAQSGTCLSDLFMRDVDQLDKVRYFVKKMGSTAESAEEIFHLLSSTSALKLLEVLRQIGWESYEPQSFFLPVVEKQFNNIPAYITEDPWIVFREGRMNKVPMIFGLASHEGVFFIPKNGNEFVYRGDFERLIPFYLKLKKDTEKTKTFVNAIREYYFGNKSIDDKENASRYIDLASDAYINRDVLLSVESLAKYNPNIYVYWFSHMGNLSTTVMKSMGLVGATHGDILAYQFYRKKKADSATSADMKVVNFFAEAWCSFASNGVPVWKNQVEAWRPFDLQRKLCLKIHSDVKNVRIPCHDALEFWKRLCFTHNSKL